MNNITPPAATAPVPDGMVIVPREPTPEMIAAMPYPANTIPAVGVACYRAMIAASPADPVVRKPLTDEQKQRIHNETGAGHSLICLVESYICGIGGGNG